MTAETDLLPLPEGYDKYDPPLFYDGQMFHEGQMRNYARNNVAHAVTPLQAEIERLQAEVEPRACEPDVDAATMLRLIKTIKYLVGIAERGEGRKIADDETPEQFVLGYVKRLEQANQDASAKRMEKALKYIRSLSSIDLVMRSDQRELTAILGNIHHNADAALAKGEGT